MPSRRGVESWHDLPTALQPCPVSHNGGLRAFDVSGDLHAGTHNGPIGLQRHGTGPVRGHVRSHNGTVAVDFGGRAADVLASAHNGTIAVARPEVEAERSDNSVLLRVGGGGGELRRITRNGDVTIR
jgi:hypothetical protein